MMLNFFDSVIIPDLVPLLILVLLGELLSPLEDLGALGLACDLNTYERLNNKEIISNKFTQTLDLTASLALRARFSACLFLLFRMVSGTAGSLPSTAMFGF